MEKVDPNINNQSVNPIGPVNTPQSNQTQLPQTPAPQTPQTPTTPEDNKKSSSKKIIIIIAFVLLILSLGVLLGIVVSKPVYNQVKKIEEERSTAGLTPHISSNSTEPAYKTGDGDETNNSNEDYLYTFYQANVHNHELTYVDDKCNLAFSFPQISFQNNEVFLWIVEAGNDRSFISYIGREQPSDELDNHVILYTKAPDDSSINWFTRLFVQCTKNSEQLTLDKYVENYLGLLQKYVDEKNPHYDPKGYTNLGEKEIGGYKFIKVGGNSNDRIAHSYLGIVNSKLYMIEYIEDAQDSIGQELLGIIDNLQFTSD